MPVGRPGVHTDEYCRARCSDGCGRGGSCHCPGQPSMCRATGESRRCAHRGPRQIATHPGHQTCTYPEHAHAACSAGSPCAVGCDDGYSPYTPPGGALNSACHCPVPNTECNGKCGLFPQGCGSAVPAPPIRKRTQSNMCPKGLIVCGVEDNAYGWECVDTTEDPQSCEHCLTMCWLSLVAVAEPSCPRWRLHGPVSLLRRHIRPRHRLYSPPTRCARRRRMHPGRLRRATLCKRLCPFIHIRRLHPCPACRLAEVFYVRALKVGTDEAHRSPAS